MSKVLLNVNISNGNNKQKFSVKGILKGEQNILIYDDPNKTRVIIDLNKNKMVYEDSEHKTEICFIENEHTNAKVSLKSNGVFINLDIYTTKIVNNNSCFFIRYVVNSMDTFEYCINILK